MVLKKMPIFRMYRLTIDKENREQFVQAGVHNLLTSKQNEPGTLAMFATHGDLDGTDNYIFELYQDDEHYNIHANSPQFAQYGQVAQKILKEKSVHELRPQYILTDNKPYVVSGGNQYVGQLLELKTSEQNVSKLKMFMEQISHIKNGALMSYAATLDESKNWMILNVYRNLADLKTSSLSNNSLIKDVVVSDKLLFVDTMVSQSGIEYGKDR